MKQAHLVCLFVALILLVGTHEQVQAWDKLTLFPLDIEALLSFDGTDRSDQVSDLGDTEFRAGLRIRQEAYSLDPGIARFLLEVESAYSWGNLDFGTVKENRNDRILSYLFQFNLFQETPGPVGFDLLTMRNTSLNQGSLGSRYDSEIETHSATARWKNTAFPMQLIYAERALKQDFLTGGTNILSRRDESLRTLTLTGRSSKLDLLIEQQSMDDRVPDRDQNFNLSRANLNHRFEWGNDSRLSSRLEFYDRTGFNANKRLSIEENARIQHTDNVFSQGSLRHFAVTQDNKTTEESGDFRLQHQLYDNLTTSANLFASSRRSDRLDQTQWRAGLDSNYQKHGLFGASVTAGLGFSYQETDRDSKLGLVEVIDERHEATLIGSVILDGRFIIDSSIIVTNPNGTLVYTQNFDYSIIRLTDDLTQLQVVPGGQIESGDTLLVSYKAQALPSQQFSTTHLRYNISINFHWLRFSHRDNKSDDTLLSGAGESFLNNNRDTITNIELHWEMGGLDTLLSAERHLNTIGDFKSTTFTYRQFLSWPINTRTLISLNMFESFNETSRLKTDLYNLELALNWQPLTGLSIRPTLGAWKSLDEDISGNGTSREDQFLMAGVTLRFLYRKIAMDLSYHHNRRTINTRETNENRVMFNLSRRF